MDSTTIEVRALTSHAEMKACVALQHAIWGEGFTDVVPASILKVAQRIGGVVVGAFDPEGSLLGFVFGLTGVERGKIVHWSDMLAVAPSARNLGLGRRLKEHQRCLVRELGASVIYWTYDPLIARNAHLNLNRLGVRVSEYAEDMYGLTDSVLHGGVPTDRLVVAWPTHDIDIDANLAEARRASESDDCLHGPVIDAEWIERATGAAILPFCLRIAVPADAEQLMRDNPDAALAWRLRVRQSLRWAFASGYTIVAFAQPDGDSGGHYLMTRPVTPRSTPSVR
jgi:chorismate synthase